MGCFMNKKKYLGCGSFDKPERFTMKWLENNEKNKNGDDNG